MKTLIYGAIALDDIYFPSTTLKNVVGGSAVYASLAASLFTDATIGGVLGSDFPKEYLKTLRSKQIDLSVLQKSSKPSFYWKAIYSEDLSNLTTLKLDMNALEDFKVDGLKLKASNCKVAFIANIDPDIQLQIMQALPDKTIKILDSMDLWIIEKRKLLEKVLKFTDIFLIGEKEVHLFADGEKMIQSIINKTMSFGPKVVIVKKGEHGMCMYGKLGTLAIPSYPLTYAIDPSGAGDSLGGVIAGVLSRIGSLNEKSIKTALMIGTVVSSFVVEDYVTERLHNLSTDEIRNRLQMFLTQLPNSEKLLVDKVL